MSDHAAPLVRFDRIYRCINFGLVLKFSWILQEQHAKRLRQSRNFTLPYFLVLVNRHLRRLPARQCPCLVRRSWSYEDIV